MAARRSPRIATVEAPAHPEGPAPRPFTVDEYYKMAEVGILRPDERIQLIEGTIVQMPPIGPEHADSVDSLAVLFLDRLRPRVRVRSQQPVRLGGLGEPEPDIALVRPPGDRQLPYRVAHPTVDDLYLVAEVADSTLAYDLGEKADMYARTGVRELWVLDIPHDQLWVHRGPTASGYADVRIIARGETIAPLAFPDITFSVDEILG